jgi:hypothetical protein
LECGAVESRQPNVKDETRRAGGRNTLQIFGSTGEGLHGVVLCREQEARLFRIEGSSSTTNTRRSGSFNPLALLLTLAILFILLGLSQ